MSRDAWRTTAVAALGVALVALSWPLHRLTDLVDPHAPYVAAELAMVVVQLSTLTWSLGACPKTRRSPSRGGVLIEPARRIWNSWLA